MPSGNQTPLWGNQTTPCGNKAPSRRKLIAGRISFAHNTFRTIFTRVVLAAAVASTSSLTPELRGDESARFRAHLDAGELGLAREIAVQTNDGALRTARLTELARLQSRVHAGQAAWTTLGHLAQGSLADQSDLGDAAVDARTGGRGGLALADFDTLINLIESTVTPDVWEANGGTGTIEPYPNGVFVDAEGLLKDVERIDSGTLERLRARALRGDASLTTDRESSLRLISLRSLQAELLRHYLTSTPLTPELRYMAGIRRISYVFVDKDRQDILIGGPAGKLAIGESGHVVHTTTGEPALQLDDFLVVLRTLERGHPFGCSITPREENLRNVQAMVSKLGPIKAGGKRRWLNGLQDAVGRQDIEVFGIAPETRAAQILVQADRHMKMIGIGLEPAVDGVTSYLDSIKVGENGEVPPMSVLRWWFVLNYDSVIATPARDAFEMTGSGVRVLSENEMLTARGKRVHTGKSEALNRQFAQSFTEHYDELAAKYPVYGELRNIFDWAMVATLIHEYGLEAESGLALDCLRDNRVSPPQHVVVSKEVESVANLRVVNGRHVIGVVSGGVQVDAKQAFDQVRNSAEGETLDVLSKRHQTVLESTALTDSARADAWWWDR